jgi:hypothetical protein
LAASIAAVAGGPPCKAPATPEPHPLCIPAGIAALRLLSQRREDFAVGVTALLLHHSGAICHDPQAAATAAAALCWGLRCLESILGRAATFALQPTYTGLALQCASAICLQLEGQLASSQCGAEGWPTSGAQVEAQLGRSAGALALVAACSSTLVAVVRHRAPALLRCAHLLTRAVQQLLLVLLAADRAARRALEVAEALAALPPAEVQGLRARHGSAAEAAELALGRLLEAVASQRLALSKYCMHVVADYVTHAACCLLPTSSPLAASPAQLPPGAAVSLLPCDDPDAGYGLVEAGACPAARSRVLRRAVFAVFGGVREADLQHLHVAMGRAHGQARRAALKQLQKDYDKEFKFSGKV